MKFATLPEPLPERPMTLEPGKTMTVELRAGLPPRSIPSQEPPEVTARLRFKQPPAADEKIELKINGHPLGPGKPDTGWVVYSLRPENVQQGVNRFEVTLGKGSKRSLVLQDMVLSVRPGKR